MSEQDLENIETSPTKQVDILAFLQQYWKKGLLTFTILALIVGAPAGWMFYSKYTATGVIRISPTNLTVLDGTDSNLGRDYNKFVVTQVSRLTQYEVLMAALNRLPPKLKGTFVQKNESLLDAAVRLQQLLQVRQIPRTYLITVGLTDYNADGLAEIVNSVINVYLDKVGQEEQGLDNRRLAFLRQEQKQIEARMTLVSRQLRELSSELGNTSFNDDSNFFLRKREQLYQAYATAKQSTLMSANALEFTLKEIAAKKQIPLDALVDDELLRDGLYSQNRSWVYNTIQGLEGSLDAYTPDNPDRERVAERIAETANNLDRLKAKLSEDLAHRLAARRDYELRQQVIQAEFLHEANKNFEVDLKAELLVAEEEVKGLSQKIILGQRLQDEYARLTALFERIESRVYSISVESKAPGRITLEAIARSLSSSNLKKLIVGVCGLAGLVTLLIYFVPFILDPRIRSRSDFERAIGYPPSWPIPDTQSDCFSRTTLTQPHSPSACALRSLAVKLNKAEGHDNRKLVTFTSVERKAGTSRLLINVAHGLRQMTDKVLVVDLNRRSHAIMDMVSSLSINRPAAIANTPVECDEERGIDICVPSSDMSKSDIENLLDNATQRYDIVFVDSAPLLDSDLSEFLTLKSDVVALVVAGNQTECKKAYETVRLLHRLEVKAIAPVLNWHTAKTDVPKRSFTQKLPQGLSRWLPFARRRRPTSNRHSSPTTRDEPAGNWESEVSALQRILRIFRSSSKVKPSVNSEKND